jgi:hypothetical protein
MREARYAVYFVPDAESDLYRFGSAAIGYDCYRAVDVPHLPAFASRVPEWSELTREPRAYGFHATMKAPFRLAERAAERDLRVTLDRVAGEWGAAPSFAPRVSLLGSFVAIIPDAMPAPLAGLANACVTAFEPYRAPLSVAERQRRLAAGLDARHTANLERWGYPYVFDEFRFHMTLTGPLPEGRGRDIVARLSQALDAAIGARPIVVDRLVLLRQAAGGRFEVIRVAPVGRAMGD